MLLNSFAVVSRVPKHEKEFPVRSSCPLSYVRWRASSVVYRSRH